MWQGLPFIEVDDSESESWCYKRPEADTIPASSQELENMGRGPGWKPEEVELLRGAIALGQGPTAVHRAFPNRSISSIKKQVVKLKSPDAGPAPRGKKSKLVPHKEVIDKMVKDDESLKTIAATLRENYDTQVSRGQLSRFIRKELKVVSVKKTRSQKLAPQNRVLRKAFCLSMLARLKLGPKMRRCTGKSVQGMSLEDIFFSDEKVFRTGGDAGRSTQNRRCWLTSKKAGGPSKA